LKPSTSFEKKKIFFLLFEGADSSLLDKGRENSKSNFPGFYSERLRAVGGESRQFGKGISEGGLFSPKEKRESIRFANKLALSQTQPSEEEKFKLSSPS